MSNKCASHTLFLATKNIILSPSISAASSPGTPSSYSASEVSLYGNALSTRRANTLPAANVLLSVVAGLPVARIRRGQKSRMIPRSNQRCPATAAAAEDDEPPSPSKQRVAGGPQASHGTATLGSCEDLDEDDDEA